MAPRISAVASAVSGGGAKRPRFAEVLEHSSVTGLPQIARARGAVKWMKMGFFLVCWVGFAWQAVAYLQIFLKFPVTLNVEVQYPEGIMIPALTICTGYRYNRMRYCKANEDHCELINDTLVLREEYKRADRHATRESLKMYGYEWKDLSFYNELGWLKSPFFGVKDPIKLQVLDNYGRITECFVTNHQVYAVNKSLILFPTKKRNLMSMTANLAHIYIFDDQKMRFGDKLKFLHISAHSPYVLQNPYLDGLTIKADTYMYGQFYLEETHLLPWPYPTDCMDYFAIWEREKNTPLSRDVCIQECIYNRVKEECNCFPLGVVYPSDLDLCGKDQESCVQKIDVEYCYRDCKPDCTSHKYFFKVEPRAMEFRISMVVRLATITEVGDDYDNVTEMSEVNGISMVLERTSKMVYRYTPKYETVELFSYIGGFVGVWLGISLTAIMDFIGILYRSVSTKR